MANVKAAALDYNGYARVAAEPVVTPIAYATVKNSKGYLDLAIHKTSNGKALRIANKDGEKVCVTLDKVDDLIKKLQAMKVSGTATSTAILPFGA